MSGCRVELRYAEPRYGERRAAGVSGFAERDGMSEDDRSGQSSHDTDAQGGGQGNGGQQQDQAKQGNGQKKRSPLVRIILIAVVLLAIIGGGLYWFLTRNQMSTDDAYTEGRKVGIAPHVSGYVTQLLVNDNQYVHKGQVLLVIDDRNYRASYDQGMASVDQAKANIAAAELSHEVATKNYPGRLVEAQGNLASAQAQLFKAQTDYRRQQSISRAATTQQDIDYAKAALAQAEAGVMQAQGQLQTAQPVKANIASSTQQVTVQQANLAQAQANLEQASLNLGWTVVRAPVDGWISQRNVERGNFVQTGQQLFSIVEPEVWVVANYKETQITRMRAGQKVDIDVDAYPSLKLHGHVDSVQLGAGAAFSTFPPENATGNYVKIVQRVPVKILIDSGLDPNVPLPLGLSVEPTVYFP
jgi:membrane fusion protein, multidrug efflux system